MRTVNTNHIIEFFGVYSYLACTLTTMACTMDSIAHNIFSYSGNTVRHQDRHILITVVEIDNYLGPIRILIHPVFL